jgi:hypothetical protein
VVSEISTVLLDPQVIDASTLVPKATSQIYLQPAVEGQMTASGTANIAVPTVINRLDEAATAFGPDSTLYTVINALLSRGAGPVIGIASAKATLPTLVQRQAAWQKLESNEAIRIRLTDSVVQADHASLAVSCANADLLYNKQIAFVGLAAGTTKANLLAAATSIAAGGQVPASRVCLVGPGVYDSTGTLQSGSFAAACVAAEVAKNADPGNDLDLWDIPSLLGIELDASALPIFRRQVISGVPKDDYEDLLQGGVSPLQPSRVSGGVSTTHLRTTFITNTSFDAIYTRIIVDQLFVDVKAYIYDNNFFRQGNTENTRARLKSGVEAVITERNTWVLPVTQPDGSQGYNVTVVPSPDMRQVTVGYEGIVVRGISTVKVAGNLQIPV